jgi:hypothetical protein
MLPATRDSRLHAWTRGLARQQAYAQKKAEKNLHPPGHIDAAVMMGS